MGLKPRCYRGQLVGCTTLKSDQCGIETQNAWRPRNGQDQLGSNRTNVGLKLKTKPTATKNSPNSSNRTNVGLKPTIPDSRRCRGAGLKSDQCGIETSVWLVRIRLGFGCSNRTNVGLKLFLLPHPQNLPHWLKSDQCGIETRLRPLAGCCSSSRAQIGPMWD